MVKIYYTKFYKIKRNVFYVYNYQNIKLSNIFLKKLDIKKKLIVFGLEKIIFVKKSA